VRQHFLRRLRLLATNLAIGVTTSNSAIRILPPTRYPYRVYYTVFEDAVVVLHIRHTARRSPDLDDLR